MHKHQKNTPQIALLHFKIATCSFVNSFFLSELAQPMKPNSVLKII